MKTRKSYLKGEKLHSLALKEKEGQVEELEVYNKMLNQYELTDSEKRDFKEKHDVTRRQVEDTNSEISNIENIKLDLERKIRVKSTFDYLNKEGSFKEERQENAHIIGQRVVEKYEEQYKQ